MMTDKDKQIISVIENAEMIQERIDGIIMVTFTKDGNTFLDHSVNMNQLASAIAVLQAEYTRFYNKDKELN